MVSLKTLFSAALMATSTLALATPRAGQPHPHAHAHARRSSGGSVSKKQGAAYNDANAVQALGNGVGWAYNWASSPDGSLPDGVEYVPMLWGTKTITQFTSGIEALLGGHDIKYVMAFNEPDIDNQAALATTQAISLFKKFLSPFSGRVKLVSPCVTNSPSQGQGLSWLTEFLGGCSDCGVAALAVHWYGESFDDFQKFVKESMDTASKHNIPEVWVTEFALNQDTARQGSNEQSADFIRKARNFLDQQDMVTRYAYFWAQENFLVQGNQPSVAGKAYIE